MEPGALTALIVGGFVFLGAIVAAYQQITLAKLNRAEIERKVNKVETDGKFDVITHAANSTLTAANTAREAAEKLTQESARAAAAKDEAHAKEIAAKDALIEALKHPVRNNGVPTGAKAAEPSMAKLTNPAAVEPVQGRDRRAAAPVQVDVVAGEVKDAVKDAIKEVAAEKVKE